MKDVSPAPNRPDGAILPGLLLFAGQSSLLSPLHAETKQLTTLSPLPVKQVRGEDAPSQVRRTLLTQ
jgi:hypothetical protein